MEEYASTHNFGKSELFELALEKGLQVIREQNLFGD